MEAWFDHLRQGLSRTKTQDRFAALRGETSTFDNLKNLRIFFTRHWRKGLLGMGIVIFLSLILFPQPLVTRYLIDDVIIAHKLEGLWASLFILGAIKGVGLVLGLVQNFYFTRFEQAVILDIQSELFERLLRFPKSFFDMTENGYLMSRIQQDVQGVQWFFSQTLVSAVSNFLRFIGGVAFLFYLEWRLAMTVLVFVPLLIIILNYFSEKIRVLSYEQLEQNANVSRTLQESLASTTLIKAFTSEKRTVNKMVGVWAAAQQLVLEQTAVGSLANFLISSLPSIANAAVFIVGAYWVVQGKWTFGSLTAFQGYLGYVFGPAMALATTNMQLQNALSSLARISALFNIIPEENSGEGKRVDRLLGEVDFKGVSFSYDGRDSIFENISFHVQAGQHVAIVGPSGVGKTTLISLIMRLYQPAKGDILFDGCLASDYELSSLRSRIGYIPQVSYLLSGTILENLRYGNSEADDLSVIEAAKVAGIHEFIFDLPDKYQTQLGESGLNLSEGQKQRVAIARALVRNPDILILDEPTSALDIFSESSFVESLKNMAFGRTIFLISHHLSTIKHADRILVLDNKHLVGFGAHSELLANNAYYRSLVESQYTLDKDVFS